MIANGKEIGTPQTDFELAPSTLAARNGRSPADTETAGIHIALASAEALVPNAPCLSLTTDPAVSQQHGFQCEEEEGEEEGFPGQ